jgi:hypothetical protein
MRTAVISLLLMAGLGGCASKSPSVDETLLGRNQTGNRKQKMVNCPSMVEGARTRIVEQADHVELLITAESPEAQAEIRDRARRQATIEGHLETPPTHDGKGTGGGSVGFCPIVHVGTRVTVTDIPGGAHIRVAAEDKSRAAELKAATRQRVASLPPEARDTSMQ